MAPQNRRIVTLRDLGSQSHHGSPEFDDSAGNSVNNTVAQSAPPSAKLPALPPAFSGSYCQPATSFKSSSNATQSSIPLCHIPILPMANACKETLERVWKEFQPIIQRRGYNVTSISELCCCGDGLDSQPGRRRPLRKQSDNVWGYNQTSFFRRGVAHRSSSTSHSIHLRLRQPRHHNTQLLSWEDVAGTMAHELSHCVHQNHSKDFYKLMEEILEEHAMLQLETMGNVIYGGRGSAAATAAPNIPETGGQRLGGATPISNVAGKSRLLDGHINTAGGRRLNENGANNPASPRSRREAMARAAERRCRQMEQLKRMIEASKEPCVIEILDDDYDDASDENPVVPLPKDEHDSKPRAVQKEAASSKKSPAHAQVLVDLTAPTPTTDRTAKRIKTIEPETIDLTSPPGDRALVRAGNAASHVPPIAKATAVDEESSSDDWECLRCTYINRSLALVCDVCHGERNLTAGVEQSEGTIEIE